MTIIPLAQSLLTGSSNLPGSFGRVVLKRFPIWSCSVRGLACHLPYGKRGALLPHLFTLTHRHPKALRRAVYFLCHFPSGHPDRELPGALPSGVRTFLPAQCHSVTPRAAVVCPSATNCQRPASEPHDRPLKTPLRPLNAPLPMQTEPCLTRHHPM